ncbi:MAG: hypothetical protein RL701_525, partial [Pseudomonadota bacterium]
MCGRRLGTTTTRSLRASVSLLAVVGVMSVVPGCATIPKREYGVRSLSVAGMDQLEGAALKICLATQERERAGFVFGVAGDPECGVPPFDASRLPVSLWTWPWTEWPIYDETVWNRDIARVARWFRARGFYDAAVVEATQKPDAKTRTIALGLKVIENQPVLVRSIALEGVESVDRKTRALLERSQQLQVGQRFDEALYDATKDAFVEALRERAYALATVQGSVSIDTAKRQAIVSYRVSLGQRFRFGKVSVEGEGVLPAQPVLAAAEIEGGAPFSVSSLNDAKRAIYELGPFASVELIEQPHAETARVDILIKVVPGRQLRTQIGLGMQVGMDPTLTPTDATGESSNRWDLHLLGRIEHRNFLGGMRRISIEDRPRVIFDSAFPNVEPPQLGNLLILEFRQPSFLEARTSFAMTARWDRGPDPYTNSARDDLLAGFGPERTFLDGKLRATATLNLNLFLPRNPDERPTLDRVVYPAYHATYLQYSLALDLRDAPREPKRGAFFAVTVQQAGYFLPSDWNYVRVTPDARGYVPLALGMVLAGRLRVGIMEITDSKINVPADAEANDRFNIRQRLHDLGPLRQRLRGGGNNSVRGYRPNALGDISQIGDVIDSGGLRQWEASLELRAPITSSFGAVFFVDIGDVSRTKEFRFRALQTSFGVGLRYRTIIGPIRLDAGFAPSSLQYTGSDDPRDRQRYTDNFRNDSVQFRES